MNIVGFLDIFLLFIVIFYYLKELRVGFIVINDGRVRSVEICFKV